MGFAVPAHQVSSAHDPLKAHPVRQDVDSAQEMTLIDYSLLTEGEAVRGNWRKQRVKTRQFTQWVLVCEMGVVTCMFASMQVQRYSCMCNSNVLSIPFSCDWNSSNLPPS